MGIPEKVKEIEDEIHSTQVNKHTERHLGLLKAKLAKLREEQERAGSGRGGGTGFGIKKGGDCTVVIIGLPSVGKSTILNQLTNAKSKVASYAFTTLTVVPGMMEHRGARIQVLDLPGIVAGAATGTGRGRKVLSVARNADLILLIVDVFQPLQISVLKKELHEIGIRLNRRPPDVVVTKSPQGGRGGITIACKLTRISESTIKGILDVYKLHSANVLIREDVGADELIDAVAGNRHYVPAAVVLNKIDLVAPEYVAQIRKDLGEDFTPVSAEKGVNLDRLKDIIYDRLGLVRVYLKPQGGEADFKEPLILRSGATIATACERIHRGLAKEAKYALVSGESVRFKVQRVGMDHAVMDGDIVTVVK